MPLPIGVAEIQALCKACREVVELCELLHLEEGGIFRDLEETPAEKERSRRRFHELRHRLDHHVGVAPDHEEPYFWEQPF